MRGYAHVIKEDLVQPDLLFLGTEFGLWISLDGGKQWAQFKGGDFPTSRCAIWPSIRATTISSSPRTAAASGSSTTSRRCARCPPTRSRRTYVFVTGGPIEQRLNAGGGWVLGDAAFVGDNPPGDAVITYYQKKRHIFGDLSIEVLGPDGKSLGTIPSSKRRGLNRVQWPMRLKAPRVPVAASAAFGANVGPRVLPGTYTVRMTKDKKVYETKVQLVPDARTTHTDADRQAQWDLSMRLYDELGRMSEATEKINGVRLGLEDRAAKLPATDPLASRLRAASAQIDTIRKRIVATKEGGAITGEERLREFLSDLYGNVIGYDGRPSQMQIDRAAALSKELDDVIHDFDAWSKKELPAINTALAKKKLEKV